MNFDFAISAFQAFRAWIQGRDRHDRTAEIIGALLARSVRDKGQIKSLHEVEFRVFSQWGDDGIIQWLIARLPGLARTFVEFGVEDYTEANTRFLLINDNWAGLVMDASSRNMERLIRRKWFWRHDLTAKTCFLTRENVDDSISSWSEARPIGLLHIDVDGNDYWLWHAIVFTRPGIVIMEYNAVFGAERSITTPYASDFQRNRAHYSGQYFGASLAALAHLANEKGYGLIGTNSAGNNAYFVRRDLLNAEVRETLVESAFTQPRFRESRDSSGRLDYLSFAQRQALLRGLPVFNVAAQCLEPF